MLGHQRHPSWQTGIVALQFSQPSFVQYLTVLTPHSALKSFYITSLFTASCDCHVCYYIINYGFKNLLCMKHMINTWMSEYIVQFVGSSWYTNLASILALILSDYTFIVCH